jgi:hypothetical protein
MRFVGGAFVLLALAACARVSRCTTPDPAKSGLSRTTCWCRRGEFA